MHDSQARGLPTNCDIYCKSLVLRKEDRQDLGLLPLGCLKCTPDTAKAQSQNNEYVNYIL